MTSDIWPIFRESTFTVRDIITASEKRALVLYLFFKFIAVCMLCARGLYEAHIFEI